MHTIKRGERILKILFPKGPALLTVGDLSAVTAEIKNRKKDVEDDFNDVCLDLGLGQVYIGPRPSDVQPSTSRSQKIEHVRLLKHQKLMEKRFLMKNPSARNAETEWLFKKQPVRAKTSRPGT